jgi:hypothetical protein
MAVRESANRLASIQEKKSLAILVARKLCPIPATIVVRMKRLLAIGTHDSFMSVLLSRLKVTTTRR